MKDPTRLLSEAGTLEARLLESVRDAEPPAAAQDEVWRRISVVAGAGAATGAAAATGAKAITHSAWLSAIKWIAVVGTVGPAVGIGAQWVIASRNASSPPMSAVSSPRPAASLEPPAALKPATTETLQGAPEGARTPAGTAVGASRRGLATSSLDAESGLLKRAREKLENGDPKAALDDVALLAARFPRGELTQEREVVAIKSLLAQGQRSAAATRTMDFLRVHPGSPYAEALKQALEP
jgi:hypothetical protein